MLRRSLPPLALALLVGLAASAGAAEDAPAVALVGGEVRPVSGPVLARGTVVVRDGVIVAVGADVAVPDGAVVIDCSGRVVTPGLIDADSALAMDGEALTGRLPGADVRAADAFDGSDARLRTALRQGVTTLQLGASRTQVVGGLASVVPTGGVTAPPLVADGALVLNLSTDDAAGGLPSAGRVAAARATFVSVRDRELELDRWRRDLAEYEEERLADGPTKEERLLLPPEVQERMRLWSPQDRVAWREAAYKSMGREKAYEKPKKVAAEPRAPRDDPSAETVASVMGKDAARRVLLRAELTAEVAAALDLVREHDLAATVAGGEGLRAHARELADARVAVVVTQLGDTAARRTSPLARREPGLAAALVAAGLRPALASGAGSAGRFLRLLAAREVGDGMDRGAALAAITLWAAEASGVADTTGSLDVGKRGDVVVWDGDPLAAASRPVHVLVGGAEVDLAE